MKFAIYDNEKLVGYVEAESSFQALKTWAEYAGPSNYSVRLA